jgi:hypothetical protein
MRIDLLPPLADPNDNDAQRGVGAVVARPTRTGGVAVEFGPADGVPFVRLTLSQQEAQRLAATVDAALKGRDEQVMLTEETP